MDNYIRGVVSRSAHIAQFYIMAKDMLSSNCSTFPWANILSKELNNIKQKVPTFCSRNLEESDYCT